MEVRRRMIRADPALIASGSQLTDADLPADSGNKTFFYYLPSCLLLGMKRKHHQNQSRIESQFFFFEKEIRGKQTEIVGLIISHEIKMRSQKE